MRNPLGDCRKAARCGVPATPRPAWAAGRGWASRSGFWQLRYRRRSGCRAMPERVLISGGRGPRGELPDGPCAESDERPCGRPGVVTPGDRMASGRGCTVAAPSGWFRCWGCGSGSASAGDGQRRGPVVLDGSTACRRRKSHRGGCRGPRGVSPAQPAREVGSSSPDAQRKGEDLCTEITQDDLDISSAGRARPSPPAGAIGPLIHAGIGSHRSAVLRLRSGS